MVILNMGRFIANFHIYSKKIPSSIFLVILPGDEVRNLKAFSETPFWDYPPKEPAAFNEIIRFINEKYFLPSLKDFEINQMDEIIYFNKKIINEIQRESIWRELEELLKKSKYPINLIVNPPKKWFEDNTYLKEIQKYDKFLNNISKLETIKETCNLNNYVFKEYKENLYVDGVHLSNKGH